jgi:hypothetical protein
VNGVNTREEIPMMLCSVRVTIVVAAAASVVAACYRRQAQMLIATDAFNFECIPDGQWAVSNYATRREVLPP